MKNRQINLNLQERFGGDQIELTLFLIVGFGYIGMAIWILIDKINTIIPFIITIVGSVFLIGIYLIAITKGVPIIGVEGESDVLATISKILQGLIISRTAILISSLGLQKANMFYAMISNRARVVINNV